MALICLLLPGLNGLTQTKISGIQILEQPVFAPVCAGESASLKVQASGSGLSYQWQVFKRWGNFEDLQDTSGYSGSHTPELNIASFSKSMNQYSYRCKISNGTEELYSEIAMAELKNAMINWQPANGTGYVGDYHSMEIYASGAGLTYQWQINTGSGFANMIDDDTYSGCKTSILSIAYLTKKMDSYQFRCLVSGKACEAATLTSDPATLTVSSEANPMKSVAGGNPSNVIWYINGTGGTPTFFGNPIVHVDGAIKVENDGQIRSQAGTGLSADIHLTGHLYIDNPTNRLFPNNDISQFIFEGADDQLIDGGDHIKNNFNKLRINKSSSAGKITLFNDISIRRNIELMSGGLNLQASKVYLTLVNSSNVPITLESGNLDSFPKILNETESNRIYGNSIFAAVVVENQEIASPGNPFADGPVNLGNMGAEIYDPENHFGAGQITLKRVHNSNSIVVETGDPMNPLYMGSIERTYTIESSPDVPVPSGMDFTFHYFDAELNGVSETNLTMFKSDDNGTNWVARAANLNTGANTIVQNDVADITTWWTAFPCTNAPNVFFYQSPEMHLCDGTVYNITPANTGGPPAAYEWILDGDTLGLNQNHYTVTGVENTPNQTLEFIAYDSLGCYDRDIVTLIHEDTLTADLGPDIGICQGLSDTLFCTTNNGSFFLWLVDGVVVNGNGSTDPFYVFYANVHGLGPHTVEVQVDNGYCFAEDTMTVTVHPQVFASLPFQLRKCAPGTTVLDANPSGGTPPYDFNWSNGGATQTITVTNANATFYVTVTDDSGCTTSDFMPMCYSNMILSQTHTNIDCFGESTGAIDLTVAGTFENLQFNWSNGATTEDLTGVPAGAYTVTVTDAAFGCSGEPYCTKTLNVTLTQPTALSLSNTVTDVLCNGQTNGAIDIMVTGGSPAYTYAWSNGETTEDLIGLPAGTYDLTVTDDNLCTATASITVAEPPLLAPPSSPAPIITGVNCNGDGDGAVDWHIEGGTLPFMFSWTGPGGFTATTEDISGLDGGTYQVTVTDDNGCTYSTSFTVPEPDVMSVLVSPENISCFGGSNGAISLTPSGGSPPYNFNWTGPNGFTSSSQNISSLEAGDYDVTITDLHDCTLTPATITISGPGAPLSVTGVVTNVTCFGAHNGTITTTVTGGWPPYTYSWLDPDDEDLPPTPNQNNLGPGTHELILFDANGCYIVEYFTIEEPDEILLNETVNNITCNGATDGSIYLNVVGGTGSYTYEWQWAGGSSTASFLENLGGPTQSYSVTVTDANNCTKTATFEVVEPAVLSATSVVQNISCTGFGDGSINLTPTGGNPAYTFSWTGPNGFTSTDEDIASLQPGVYEVTINDSNSCTPFTNSYTILEPTQLTANPLITNPLECFGDTDGQINANPSGGTPPYTYLWTYPDLTTTATTQFISNLSQTGDYSIEVYDANGCYNLPAEVMIELTSPPEILTSGVVTDVSINGGSDGAIDLTVSGGTGAFTFLWSNGETTEDITGLTSGTYIVTATDASGCEKLDTFTVNEPAALAIELEDLTHVSCNGGSDGSILTFGSGGVAPYTYSWSNGETSAEINDLFAGAYTLTVTDDNGATAVQTFTVLEPDPILPNAVQVNVTCNGAGDGSITLSPTGGTSPFSYLWSNQEVSNQIINLFPGPYSVTITDENSCTFSAGYTITEPDLLTVSSAASDASCFGAGDGSIELTPAGGTSPFAYNWDNGVTTGSGTGTNIPNLFAGNYDITLTDDNSCMATTAATVGQPPSQNVEITGDAFICEGETSILDAGAGFTDYSWSTGETTQTITVSVAAVYTVTITGTGGCTESDDFELTVYPLPTFSVNSVTCSPDLLTYDVEITSNATSVTADFGVVTDNNNGTFTISEVPAGQDVTITATDAFCENVQEVTAPVCACPTIDPPASNGDESICFGETIPTLSVNVGTNETADWYDAATGGTLLLQSSLSYTPTEAGTFYVETRNTINNCVSNTRTAVTLTIHPLPIANAGADIAICIGASTQMNASASSGSGPLTYLWSPADSLNNPNIVNPIANPTTTTTYTVLVTDANSCSASDEVVVTVNTLPVANAGADVSICAGSNTQLDAGSSTGNGTLSYSWSPASGLTDPNIANPVASPSGTTAYTVLVTDGNSCTASDTVVVTVNPLPTLTLNSTLCAPNLLTYDVTVTSNAEMLTANFGSVINNNNGTFSINGVPTGQNVTLTATLNSTGCQKILVVTAPVCACPVVDPPVSNGDESICFGETIPALTVTVNANETADWYDAPTGGNLLLSGSTSYAPTGAGTFYAEARNTINNCVSSTRTALTLTVNPLPTTNAGPDVAICIGASTQLDASGSTGSGTLTYLWSPATGLSNPNIVNPIANPTDTTIYTVTVTDANNCSESDEVVVAVNELPVLTVDTTFCAPNLLTYSVLVETSGDNLTATAGTVTNNGGGSFTVSGVPAGQNVVLTAIFTATGCQSSQLVVAPDCSCPTVIAPVSLGNQEICEGSPIHILIVTVGTDETADWYDAPTGGNLLLQNSTSYAPTAAGTFYAEARNTINNCVSDERTAVILTINPLPLANAGPDVAICSGSSTTLNAGGSSGAGTLTFQWTPAGSLSDPNIVNPVATPSATTTYTVSVTDGNGCVNTDQIVVTVNPLPVLTVLNTTCAPNLLSYSVSVTSNGTVTASLGTVTANGGNSYTISGVPTGQNVTITATFAATGCQRVQTVISPLCPCPVVNAPVSGGNQTICVSSPIPALTVTVPANHTVDWYTSASGDTLLLAGSTSYTPTAAGTYYAEARNTINECVSSTRTALVLTINPLPVANAGPDVAICSGSSTTLNAGGSTGASPLSFLWSPATGLSNPNISNPVASPAITRTYTVLVTDGNGCTNTDTVVVTVNPLPTLAVSNAICAPDLLSYEVEMTSTGDSVVANFGTVINNGGGSYTVTGIPAGQNIVIIAFITATGCQRTQGVNAPDCSCPVVDAPVSGGDVEICVSDTIPALTVSVAAGQTADWYDAPSGGTLLLSGDTSYLPSVAGSFYAEARDITNNCVSGTRTPVVLTIHDLPVANAGSDVTICAGASTTLNAGSSTGAGILTYLWTPAAGLSDTTIVNPVANPADTTAYAVMVTDENGCSASDTVVVSVNDLPLANAGLDTAICLGASAMLDAGGSTGNGVLVYAWSPVADLSDPNIANPVANPSSTTIYTVTVTDGNGCTATDETTLTIYDLPIANAGLDVEICAGGSTVLDAGGSSGSGTLSFLWSPAANLSDPTISNPTVDPINTVTYTVEVTDGNGCISTDEVEVQVNNLPFADAGPDVAICSEASTTLNAGGSTGSGFLTYAWSPSTGLSATNIPNPVADPLSTTTYTLEVTDGNGCTATDMITVTVQPLPGIIINSAVCAPNLLTYSVTLSTDGNTVTASAGTVTNNGGGSFTVNGVPAGQNVTVTSFFTATGCQFSQLVVAPDCSCPFVAAPVSGGNQAICFGNTIPALTVTVGADETADWYSAPVGGTLLLSGNTSYTPTTAGTYYAETRNTIHNCVSNTRTAVVLTINPLPVANAGPDVPICSGGSTQLNAGSSSGSGTLSYAWSPGTGLSATNIANPIASPLATTTYTVMVTDGNGCTATDQVLVIVNPLPVITVNNVVCDAGLLSYYVIITTNADVVTSTEGTVSSLGGNSWIINLVPTGTNITITATFSSTGCARPQGVNSPNCSCPPINPPVSGGDQAICLGQPIPALTVTVNSGETASWFDAPTGGVMLISGVTSFTPNGAGTFYVETLNPVSNCTSTTRTPVTLTINSGLVANAGADTITCSGIGVELDAGGSTGSGGLTYEWSPADGLSDPNIVNPIANPAATTTYTLTVTDGAGCIATDEVLVTVGELPSLAIDVPICSPDLLTYDVNITTDADEVTASAGTIVDNGGGSYTIVNIPAAQNLTIIVSYTATGCQVTQLILAPNCGCPVVDAPLSNGDEEICEGDTIPALTVSVNAGETADWYDAATGGNLLLSGNTSYTPTAAGTYFAETRIIANNCTSDSRVAVTLTVNPLPVLTFDDPTDACAGGSSVVLSASPNGGTFSGAGVSGNEFDPVAAGVGVHVLTYSYTDVNGCENTATQEIEVFDLPIAAAQSNSPVCEGGDLQLTENGGEAVEWAWTGPNGFVSPEQNPVVNAATSANAGIYEVTITSATGCVNTASVTIDLNPSLSLSLSPSPATFCPGGNVQLVATPSGGNGVFDYEWTTPSGSETGQGIFATEAGTYFVTVTDGNGCSIAGSVGVSELSTMTVTFTPTNASCNGTNGALTADVSGGQAPYTYEWDGYPDTTNMLAGIPVGSYQLIVTDDAGCVFSAIGVVGNTDAPVVSLISSEDVNCAGDADGSITVDVTGGSTPYAFNWSNGETTQNIAGLAAGQYELEITDALGCMVTAIYEIEEPSTIVGVLTTTQTSTPSTNDGSIDLTVSGGQPPYQFNWSNGLNSEDISNLFVGPYSVTITDANGCSIIENTTITAVGALAVSLTGQNISCNGSNDGSVEAVISGGAMPYSILWSTGSTLSVIENLSPGTYQVTVTDLDGNTTTGSVNLTQPALLQSFTQMTGNVCNGGNSGTANIVPSGGTSPYTFAWSNGETTQAISGLAAGDYTVTLTDANGCTNEKTVTISEPSAVQIVVNAVTGNDCFGQLNGAVDISVSGGAAPYFANWSNSATTQDISGLAAGTYTVTITDFQGCTTTASVDVSQAPQIAISFDNTAVNCFGEANGSLTANVSGGTPGASGYEFIWTNGDTTATIDGLVSANYFVTVTDAAGCTAVSNDFVSQPAILLGNLTTTAITCFGDANGSAEVQPSGGIMPYTYAWDNGATDSLIENLDAGAYSLTITDANGCTATETVQIIEPDELLATTAVTDLTCFNNFSGAIDLTITGGIPAYVTNWSTGQFNEDINQLAAGDYTVTIVDVNGCEILETVTVAQPDQMLVTEVVTHVSCYDGGDGSVAFTVSGGNAPYTFNWDNGATTPEITGLAVGTYAGTITDNNGCTVTAETEITQPEFFSMESELQRAGCKNPNDGSIDITVAGGVPDYVFSWSNGASTEDISQLAVGTYGVTVTDDNGCTISQTFGVAGSGGTFEAHFLAASGLFDVDSVEVTPDDIIQFIDVSRPAAQSWEWFFGDPANSTSTEEDPVFSYPNDESAPQSSYLVTLVASNLFCTDTMTKKIWITNNFRLTNPDEDSLVYLTFTDVLAYPNPTSGWVTLDVKLSREENVRLYVVNVLGEILERSELEGDDHYQTKLDFADRTPGLYFIYLRSVNQVHTVKIVVSDE